MPEQELNRAQVGSRLQEVDRERVAERVRGNRLGESRTSDGAFAGKLDRLATDRFLRALAGKEPVPRPVDLSPGAQHLEQLRLLRHGDHIVEDPLLPEGDPIEEAERRDGDDQRARRQLALVGQVDLVGANLLRTETGRGTAEVAGESRDGLDVRLLGCTATAAAPACP